ncbi:class I SAM-dependent methyltransferase [Nocardia brasiliensis]|uniref:class I SAM-dependent methyltransferase n=1 Tax=Nocardia brasiliensis TaxID=37326 RepID=UPI0018941719|nr:class I SAM-dependent methyltransferase [Nocardia brasiliensis]MBF6126600.1 class I SAM-dependent methyltransferase [Nocardia brasiliensis]
MSSVISRIVDGVDDLLSRALTAGFDHAMKRHSDERQFWNMLFTSKLECHERTGLTDWDNPKSRTYYRLLHKDLTALVGRQASVIEMGCGTAVLSLLLAADGSEVTLVDRSEPGLAYARVIEQALREELTFVGSVKYVHADFTSLDRSLRADLVHNAGVIEEMDMSEAVRVVSLMRDHADRQVVVGVPNFFNPYLLGFWLRGGKGTERHYSRRGVERVLNSAGLPDVSVVNTSCVHPSLPAWANQGFGLGFLHLAAAAV